MWLKFESLTDKFSKNESKTDLRNYNGNGKQNAAKWLETVGYLLAHHIPKNIPKYLLRENKRKTYRKEENR